MSQENESSTPNWLVRTRGAEVHLAVTVSNVISPTADTPCVAHWDSVSYKRDAPHCLRRVYEDLHYPADLTGGGARRWRELVRALWDIRGALGHVGADTLIIEAQFAFVGDTTMPEEARAMVAAPQRL